MPKYTALSYCWGANQAEHFKTTKQTVARLFEGFSLEELPMTLQDAVWTTVKLGLRYLWVDALCIVQDDDYDKAHEISMMPSIYSQAVVNIAASRASGAGQGFLGLRDLAALGLQTRFVLPAMSFTGLNSTAYLSQAGGDPMEPLEGRAWVLQERILSPRVLQFGSTQTSWKCFHSLRKEISMVDGGKQTKFSLE